MQSSAVVAPIPRAAPALSPAPGPTGILAGRPSAAAAAELRVPAISCGPSTSGTWIRSANAGPAANARKSRRTPDLPYATGIASGLTATNLRAETWFRAAVDGVAAGLAYCQEALARVNVCKEIVTLVGGGSRHATWQQAIADATGLPVQVRGGGEHVARGAAVQIAAIVRAEPVAQLAEAWRPDVIAQATPRGELREAFRLSERRELIAAMKVGAA
jgi:sugar (pentulose or hexulose) kinase